MVVDEVCVIHKNSRQVLLLALLLSHLHRWIEHVFLVEHRTLQNNSAAYHYVSPRESSSSTQPDLQIIMQSFT